MARKSVPVPDDLKALEKQFAAWREQKKSSAERIPPELWSEAVELTRCYKVSTVARRVGICVQDLRVRAEKSTIITRKKSPEAPRAGHATLVKLAPIVLPMPPESQSNDSILEIEGPNNLRLRVTGKDIEKVVRIYMEGCR